MAERALEEVRAWKQAAYEEYKDLSVAETIKRMRAKSQALRKKHNLNLEVISDPSELGVPKRNIMHVPEELVPEVQKLIDDYKKRKTG